MNETDESKSNRNAAVAGTLVLLAFAGITALLFWSPKEKKAVNGVKKSKKEKK